MEMPDTSCLTALDYVIIVVLLAGLVSGFIKGVVRQAFSLGGLLAGLIVGALFSKPVAATLLRYFAMSEKSASVVAFVLILIVVPLICTVLGGLLSKLIKVVKLGFADRLLGAVFGLLKYLVFMGLFIQLLEISGISDNIIRNGNGEHRSLLYEPVRKTTDTCLHWAWDKVKEHAGQVSSDEKE